MIIKKIRKETGLTQEDIAKILECSREEISYFENNKRKISISRIQKLLDFVGYENGKITVQSSCHTKDGIKYALFLNKFVKNLSEIKRINKI